MRFKWTQRAEDLVLREYKRGTPQHRAALARRIGTTPRGLRVKAWELGLFLSPGHCRPDTLDGEPDRPLPPEATQAPPWSEEKILVMQQRLAEGFSVFHPEDA